MTKFAGFGLLLALAVVLAGCGEEKKQPAETGKAGNGGPTGNGAKHANGNGNGKRLADGTKSPGTKTAKPNGKAQAPDGEPGKPSPGKTVAQGSPESVYNALRDAVGEEKWVEAFVFLTPESQTVMISHAILGAKSGAAGDPQKAKELQALGKQYGIDLQPDEEAADAQEIRRRAAKVQDKPAAFAALVSWIEKNPPEGEEKAAGIAESIQKSKLASQPQVEGDRATATITTPQNKEMPIAFQRIDGKWYVDFAGAVVQERKPAPKPESDSPKKDLKKESETETPKPDAAGKPEKGAGPGGAKKKGTPEPEGTEKP